MSSNSKRNASESENTCVVCFKSVTTYSIGICDHPVCYECSTRMRVLCKQNECPICRRDMPRVHFTKTIEPFAKLFDRNERRDLIDSKFGIVFGSRNIQQDYYYLLEFSCNICMDSQYPFKTFSLLKDHMRREHELYYCDLCVDNLKIFPYERKCYTRSELAQHRRKGDTDNTSHRGHPLCVFCDTRYMDNDELYRHLRRDHFYCHFCDADGKHLYYSTYEDLRAHFLEEHYLCEEGECRNEQFTSVFRTDIDLKAHAATVHSRNLGKAAMKQARTLEVEFNFAPRRPDHIDQRIGRRHREIEVGPSVEYVPEIETTVPLQPADFPSLSNSMLPMAPMAVSGGSGKRPGGGTTVTFTAKCQTMPSFMREDDFPSLGRGSSAPLLNLMTNGKPTKRGGTVNDLPTSSGSPGPFTIPKKGNSLKKNSENFPVLGGASAAGITSTMKVTVNQDRPQSLRQNMSIQLNHKSNGAVTTRITRSVTNTTTSTIKVRPKTMEAFPALGSSTGPPLEAPSQWRQPKKEPKKEPKVAPAPELPKKSDFPSLSQQNQQPQSSKSKKSTSVSVPVNNDWVNLNSLEARNKARDKAKRRQEEEAAIQAIVEAKALAEAKANKEKDKKKKGKTKTEVLDNDVNKLNNNVGKNVANTNGIIKKCSTLNIGTLSEPETLVGHVEGGPSPGHAPLLPPPGLSTNKKAPPGIGVKPPPGFNCLPSSAANDLTFTNSSGRSYAIVPPTLDDLELPVSAEGRVYQPPANFSARNTALAQRFLDVMKTEEAINEFKSYSDLFRKGNYPAEKFVDHCQHVLGKSFGPIFPELLVLLPDIDKQQELYRLYKRQQRKSTAGLEVCATCKQVLFSSELKYHLHNHYMENHFPNLTRNTISTPNAWKK